MGRQVATTSSTAAAVLPPLSVGHALAEAGVQSVCTEAGIPFAPAQVAPAHQAAVHRGCTVRA